MTKGEIVAGVILLLAVIVILSVAWWIFSAIAGTAWALFKLVLIVLGGIFLFNLIWGRDADS